MREIRLVEDAVFPPGFCAICGGSEGSMIDTGADSPLGDRLYLCARVCLPLIADAGGYLSVEQAGNMGDKLSELAEEIARLEAGRAGREVVSVQPPDSTFNPESQWQKGSLAKQPWGGSTLTIPIAPDATKGERWTRLCTSMKKDGSPCSAFALPGRDVCVAHSKVVA